MSSETLLLPSQQAAIYNSDLTSQVEPIMITGISPPLTSTIKPVDTFSHPPGGKIPRSFCAMCTWTGFHLSTSAYVGQKRRTAQLLQ